MGLGPAACWRARAVSATNLRSELRARRGGGRALLQWQALLFWPACCTGQPCCTGQRRAHCGQRLLSAVHHPGRGVAALRRPAASPAVVVQPCVRLGRGTLVW